MTTQRAKTITRPTNRDEPDRKTAWQDYAACDGQDVELWFAESGGAKRFDQARAICLACPVRAMCLRDALAEEGDSPASARFGIRGALTSGQRAVIGGGASDEPLKCGSDVGTAKGVARHREAGSKVLCPACHWYTQDHPEPAEEKTGGRKVAGCGTPSGYSRHRRAHTKPCQPCIAAHSEAAREYRQRKAS